jgi:hypothetical protein
MSQPGFGIVIEAGDGAGRMIMVFRSSTMRSMLFRDGRYPELDLHLQYDRLVPSADITAGVS